MKKCTKCGKEKSFREFHKHKLHRDGLTTHCKDCRVISTKEYNANNKEKIRIRDKKYLQNNKEKVRIRRIKYYKKERKNILEKKKIYYRENKTIRSMYNKSYRKANKEDLARKNKDWRYREKYGMSLVEAEERYVFQGKKCLGCDKELGINFVVDHDHNTNKVRGLLHDNCNKALGFVNDDPEILRALANYLETKR